MFILREINSREEKYVGEHITISSENGYFRAYVARPDISFAPAVVVLPEIFWCNHTFARRTGTHYNAIATTMAYGRTWQCLSDHLR